MVIGKSEFYKGKSIQMHAVFFYYQLIEEGEFSCGQTSYWLFEDYLCWDLLDLELNEPEGVSFNIDCNFIKEAAVIYLLCMLDDYYFEFEEHEWPTAENKIIKTLRSAGKKLIPKVEKLVQCLLPQSGKIDFIIYRKIQAQIFNEYVFGSFEKLLGIGNLTK